MKVIGEVQIILRDSITDEIAFEHKQDNIITEWFYNKLLLTNQLTGYTSIVITSAPMESSKFTHVFPGDGANSVYTSFPNSIVPSNGNWNQYVAPTETTTGFVQFAGRYNAPNLGTSRTIRSVGLGSVFSSIGNSQSSFTVSNNSTYLSFTSSSDFYPLAFLKLATPCIQTDTQVLDVFYRIFFPYDSSESELSLAMIKQQLDVYTRLNSFTNRGFVSPFKIPTRKSYDSDKTMLSFNSYYRTRFKKEFTPTIVNQTTPLQTKGFTYTDANFTDNYGYIINSLIWNNTAQTIIPSPESFNTSNSVGYPNVYTNFNSANKIGNLIGQAQLLSTTTANPFLDVDNLPSGTGKIFLGGSWSNSGSPLSSGLYYTYKFPERNIIKITNSGGVGVSTYKLIKQKSIGIRPYFEDEATLKSLTRYYTEPIWPLGGSIPADTNPSRGPVRTITTYDYNTTLIGDVTDLKFAGPHISSCDRYDDSSIIVVKKDEIILYNIPAGDYWRYTAAYTNIHQIAVVNSKIYVACKDTGLWVIDPYNSLVVTNISSPGNGIDLSVCYGVAKGYGNIVWAVGANCLASFNGSIWTRYDSTTSPAFNMTGVSDNNWSNIEYLKVDEDNVDNQMLLVRKYDATVDSTLLGVWWSTVGNAINTGSEPVSTSVHLGRPRIHRKHVGGLYGLWAVVAQNRHYVMTFGLTTFTATTVNIGATTAATYVVFNSIFSSIKIIKNNLNQPRLVIQYVANDFTWQGNEPTRVYTSNFYLVDAAGQTTDTISHNNHGLSLTPDLLNVGSAFGGTNIRTTSSGLYSGRYDQSVSFILSPGIMIFAFNEISQNTISSDNIFIGGTTFHVCNYGLDKTPNGGALAYLSRQEYGWDGTQWILDNISSRSTHTTTEQLSDGVTVRFENGAAGTSFINNNVYLYTLSDGIFKDNATRATYETTLYYYRKVIKNATELQSSAVPTVTPLSTGLIGINYLKSSAGVTINIDNEVIFSGLNTRQYAIGDKEVTGDFIISLNVTNVNATDVRNAAMFGVTRVDHINNGIIQFGFMWSGGQLFWYDNGTTTSIANPASASMLEIRRTSGVLELVRNGTVVRTHNNSVIRPADYRLYTMFGVRDTRNTVPYEGGIRVPAATITSNGSDNAVYFGNSISGSGAYNERFYGLDVWTTGATTITLNGVPATIKTDGTAPGEGEITVDGLKGIMYFNSADAGKALAANYLYQVS